MGVAGVDAKGGEVETLPVVAPRLAPTDTVDETLSSSRVTSKSV